MARPRLLLLDEPSMGLAPMLVETIFATIEEINRSGTTILLVEQNAHAALQVAHRGYVLQTGADRAEQQRRRTTERPDDPAGVFGDRLGCVIASSDRFQ